MSVDWKTMASAPRNKTQVLLFTTCHGIVEGWYWPAEIVRTYEGDEAEGCAWVCADDAFQIEVEDNGEHGYHDGTVVAWAELPETPEWVTRA